MPLIKKKTSLLWNHFTEIGYQKAKCDYCGVGISISGGALNNLKRHMTAKHVTISLSTLSNDPPVQHSHQPTGN